MLDGHQYFLTLVDRETCYNWTYGKEFWLDAGQLLSKYCTKFHKWMDRGRPKKAPFYRLKDCGSPTGTSKSERNSGKNLWKSPINELLLPHRDTNAKRVLSLCHIPLHPHAQRLLRKSVPSPQKSTVPSQGLLVTLLCNTKLCQELL